MPEYAARIASFDFAQDKFWGAAGFFDYRFDVAQRSLRMPAAQGSLSAADGRRARLIPDWRR